MLEKLNMGKRLLKGNSTFNIYKKSLKRQNVVIKITSWQHMKGQGKLTRNPMFSAAFEAA